MYQIPSQVLQYLDAGPATILVAPDAPVFTIIYANPAYHQATLTTPADIVGLGFLEAFPESPDDPYGDNVVVLRTSLIECVNTKKRVELPGKRYDVPVRGTNKFETKYWQASNNPVLNDNGELEYIAHVTVEITGAYELARKERIAREVTEAKRRELHALLMEAPAAIAILDGPDLVYEFENAIHRRLFPDRQLLGKSLKEAFPGYEKSSLSGILKNVYDSGVYHEEKEVLINVVVPETEVKDEQYWNFVYQPKYNNVNQIDGIVVFAYHVTDQVMSRKRVEDSEKRLQTILDTMAEGVGIVDQNGQMLYANAMAERLLGIKKDLIMERTHFAPAWKNLRLDGSPLPPEEHPVSISMTKAEPVFDHEVGVQARDGEILYLSINAAPLKDENGDVSGAVGTFMDVTQRRKSARMKDEFISTVSHELKTPLTSIKAYLQMLERSLAGQENLKGRSFLDRLGVQVDRLEHLIKDFLDVTRIDSGKLVLRATEFQMDKVLKELIHDLQLLTPTHKLLITRAEPVKVVSDQHRVVQVLTNLITNAVKYSPGANEVLISLVKRGEEVVCSVQDLGIGIEESQQALVFDRFHQAGYNKGSGLSLGLGLYISKEIVERAGGRIWLESTQGKGSIFYFSLSLSNV